MHSLIFFCRYGYSNIVVTAPSPENLGMMFQFIVRSFEALGYKEHLDYDVVTSTNPAFNKAVVRVNVYRSHRQTIAYIQPQHAERASHAELLVIDEAAAIPLPLVKALFGPYLVFLSSTVNGYEGTGRSLSLKLIQQLRNQAGSRTDGVSGRTLREVTLDEPIRYANGDRVEKWLHNLLCLDCTKSSPPLAGGCPHPKECELFLVERDTLFSYHKASEQFLQDMMSLYVSSHYKNTPNDLQMLSDAPAHQLYVLLGPNSAKSGGRPDILCVVQVCMEGNIARSSAMSGLAQGAKSNGDLIPWTVSQQFQDPEFASLSGARVVRIATHPNLVKMGYGTRALQILSQYFSGGIIGNADEVHGNAELKSDDVIGIGSSSLMSDELRSRTNLPPLLVALTDRPPEILHWIGVSYGITPELHKFWSKGGYVPVYLRQTANDITGEHTCIMLKQLQPAHLSAGGNVAVLPADEWCSALTQDFRRRFVQLLG
jgi:N-acetyltransferase 10